MITSLKSKAQFADRGSAPTGELAAPDVRSYCVTAVGAPTPLGEQAARERRT